MMGAFIECGQGYGSKKQPKKRMTARLAQMGAAIKDLRSGKIRELEAEIRLLQRQQKEQQNSRRYESERYRQKLAEIVSIKAESPPPKEASPVNPRKRKIRFD